MCIKQKLAAVILAGGYSSRAPAFKPLLPIGKLTVIERGIQNFQRAGIDNIVVVLGYRADELIPVLDRLKVRYVVNKNYHTGMFSSILTGIQSLQPDLEAFYLLPADMPLIKSQTFTALHRMYQQTGADIIYPVFQGLRGHPPLISMRLLPAILAYGSPGGLRCLLNRYEKNAYEVEVFDEGIMRDIDTPEDYRQMIECYNCRDIPTQQECDAILAKMKVPDVVVTHSRLVAEVAQKIAIRLNENGLHLSLNLLLAAGLLHDLAKGKPNHAYCGAKMIKQLGYPKVAKIVAAHIDMNVREELLLDEKAILYLADKMVENDHIVSIHERFQYSMDKYAKDAEVFAAVAKRLFTAQSVAQAVERIAGISLYDVVSIECMAYSLQERQMTNGYAR